MHPVLALSLHGTLTDIGALAGLVAIPGVAVLALLYFAQAREGKRLREWAGRAPERAAELQGPVGGGPAGAGPPPPGGRPPRNRRRPPPAGGPPARHSGGESGARTDARVQAD